MNKSNILFVHLPRTGGTFIADYGKATKLINYYANYKQRDQHMPARDIKEPEKWFSFGLIRNPFDWYVSQYFYFINKGKRYAGKNPSQIVEQGIFKGVAAESYGEEFIAKFPKFKNWMMYGYDNRYKLPYFWLINVYKYMFFDDKGKQLVNYIGKFENLDNVINAIFDSQAIEPEISFKSFKGDRNATEHKNYREYYDDETRIIVEEMDSEIFKKYGYIF